MHLLLTALIAVVIVICGLFVLLLLAILTFTAFADYYLMRLQLELPWLKWLTLQEVIALGFSQFWAAMLLPVLHHHKMLEVRLRDDVEIPEFERESIVHLGFSYWSVKYHEFKLTKHRGRRKKFDWKALNPFPTLKPAWN